MTALEPIGMENNTNKAAMIHALHQPIDISTSFSSSSSSSSIIACVKANNNDINHNNHNNHNYHNYHNYHNNGINQHSSNNINEAFIILQDDNNNNNNNNNNNEKGYNTNNNSLHSTTSHESIEEDSKTIMFHHHNQGGGGGVKSFKATMVKFTPTKYIHHQQQYHQQQQHEQQQHHYNQNTSSSFTIMKDLVLPRMTNITYHPNTGYVYSIGSSIYSIPCSITQEILSSSLPPHNIQNKQQQQQQLYNFPKIYYHGTNILPLSGGGVRSGNGALSIICNGHVLITAMKNGSFYAVSSSSGKNVSNRFWMSQLEKERKNINIQHNQSEQQQARSSTGVSSSSSSNDEKEIGKGDVEKILTFRQASPVHPAISVEIPMKNYNTPTVEGEYHTKKKNSGQDGEEDDGVDDGEDEVSTSLVFLASGRECAVVEVLYNPNLYSNNRHSRLYSGSQDDEMDILPSPSISSGSIVVGLPRHGIATLASPIMAAVGLIPSNDSLSKLSSSTLLSAASSTPLVAILTSDGLVHTRSPSYISIPLSTIEVGNRPNDFFTLQPLPNKRVVAGSYSGNARLISFKDDSEQDLADRTMKLCIDAFGTNGFPRAELADAIGATFSATSYVGSEPSASARNILKQYLETCLGLDIGGDFGGAPLFRQFLFGNSEVYDDDDIHGHEKNGAMLPFASSYLCATAMLCLVCTRLSTPNSSLANRAAKACANKFGIVGSVKQTRINMSCIKVCEMIAQRLLVESESTRSITPSSGIATGRNGIRMTMVEAASWLLRCCGQHETSIKILRERMSNPTLRNRTFIEGDEGYDITSTKNGAGWSQLKYDSHLCAHLGELWSFGDNHCKEIVLQSSATQDVLTSNPSLGVRIFTSSLPQNEDQWLKVSNGSLTESDTTATKVVEMLKSVRPRVHIRKAAQIIDADDTIPLESGNALAVVYLEAMVGISTKRPPMKNTNTSNEDIIGIHNELAFLLLEGVLSERTVSDGKGNEDSVLGKMYRKRLRRLLGWHSSMVQPDQLMQALPSSFLREKALLLGQLGRHEDALRIFYSDLKSLDLALEYCDARYEKIHAHYKIEYKNNGRNGRVKQSCAYLPLVRVALESDTDDERGIAAAVKVLSLRRENIDQAAALRLLPKTIPVSTLAQTFLIPALIDSESQARRLTVAASLLRAKYLRLKKSLTEAQIKSQSILQNVPALQALHLGDSVYISKPFKARPSNSSSSHFPDVTITKHFFHRYVIIQATVTAINDLLVLGDVQLVVAESSDEALLPSVNVPIKILPSGMTGSSWCVLAASPQRLDGTAVLVCEMHYTISSHDVTTNATAYPSSSGRSFVEEIRDIEIRRAEFDG